MHTCHSNARCLVFSGALCSFRCIAIGAFYKFTRCTNFEASRTHEAHYVKKKNEKKAKFMPNLKF
jgi:hypothetical protein